MFLIVTFMLYINNCAVLLMSFRKYRKKKFSMDIQHIPENLEMEEDWVHVRLTRPAIYSKIS